MTSIPPAEIEQIITYAKLILSDGVARKSSEIVRLLEHHGLHTDKKKVNHALYFYGGSAIEYDPSSYTYRLAGHLGATPVDGSSANAEETRERPLDTAGLHDSEPHIENGFILGVFVRFPIDGEAATSIADCRDFRIGKVVSINEQECSVSLVPASNDSYTARHVVIPTPLIRRCKLRPQAPFTHLQTAMSGTILIAASQSFDADSPMYYYVALNGSVQCVSEIEISVDSSSQDPLPQQQIAEYEFHPAIWRSKRDQLLKSYIQLRSATFGIEEIVGARILLLPHQAETIARILGDRQCRYVLADEVGLGKTIEACVILKGLKRRNPQLKTLIVVPDSVIRQWHNELDSKFWMNFPLISESNRFRFSTDSPGILISIEDLQHHPRLADSLLKRHWDLLIVDEAHRLNYNPTQYEIVLRLSAAVEHCLILSATPILRHSTEYLSLLRLMDPHHYGAMSPNQFDAMLAAQADLRRRLAYVGRSLNASDYDQNEFLEEITPLLDVLTDDEVLPALLRTVSVQSSDGSLRAAQEVHSYLSENYRIENRVIRNRRAALAGQLSLPTRVFEDEYSYSPATEERETLGELTEYSAALLSHTPEAIEFVRLLHFAAGSSAHALVTIVEARKSWITERHLSVGLQQSLKSLIASVREFQGEILLLERLEWHLTAWKRSTLSACETSVSGKKPDVHAPHRLLQVIRAVYKICRDDGQKVLVFCRWDETRHTLEQLLKKHFGTRALAVFHSNLSPDDLQNEVDRFQSDLECKIMLSDETGGEGRNFQVASAVIHVDLPWMPSQVEQRIGRVDRIGRTGQVTSIVPYARQTIEFDLFQLWHTALQLFTRSTSGMEIILEAIQDEITAAFAKNPREGLSEILDSLIARVRELRSVVEEERYAEENAAQYFRREDFQRILDEYEDGEQLKTPLLKWAEMAGFLNHSQFDQATGVQFTVFDPKQFNHNAIKNARYVNPPDMQEALRRSGRQRKLIIRGTFDRRIAVQREDVVFFAPGENWTDALIQNALQSDRGKSTAIMRHVPELNEDWEGFDCLYSILVDPRPLFKASVDPVHLFRAQGYLSIPWHRVVIGLDGQIVKRSGVIWEATKDSQLRSGDIHLGKRSGENSPLRLFMERFPPNKWADIVSSVFTRAEEVVREEFSFASELAEEAHAVYTRRILGQRAAHQWLRGEPSNAEIDEYERISTLLIEGIAHPLIQLESACFWWLKSPSGY